MSVPQMRFEDKNHTVAEVAEAFRVKEATVRIWINRKDEKRLDAFKTGKSWLISKDALIRFANKMYGVDS